MTVLNLFDLWQSIMSEVNVQQGGNIRPQIDFQSWVNAISMELFHERAAAAELNDMIDDDLATFLLSAYTALISQPGQPWWLLPRPSNYAYFAGCKVLRQLPDKIAIVDGDGQCLQFNDKDYAALRQKFAGKNLIESTVKKLDEQRWESCLGHRFKKPTFQNPKMVQYSAGFKVAPAGIGGVVLDYYRLPKDCVFAYTIGTGDIIQYNAGASIQLEWGENLKNEFLTRLKKKYAIYVREEGLYGQAVNDKKELK